MTAIKRLYELQLLDIDIQQERDAYEQINGRLGESEALIQVKAEVAAEEEHLSVVIKQQRNLELEIEDLSAKITQASDKLYGGNVKNPKELVSIEQEVEIFKTKLSQQEDALLDAMTDVEATQKRIKVSNERLRMMNEDWQEEQKGLSQQQKEIENRIADLEQKRRRLTTDISPKNLELYEATKSRKGQAVVKIEQGRCQGCRLMLSTSELQRARAGNTVLCSTCNRILYLG